MASKLAAAKMASWSGARAVIAAAISANVLVDAVAGRAGRHHLRAERPSSRGAQVVDRLRQSGRRRRHGRRRRPPGVGRARHARCCRPESSASAAIFDEGDVVEVRDTDGRARCPRHGVERCADLCARSIGKRTGDLPSHVAHEVIHRDDLVLLPPDPVAASPQHRRTRLRIGAAGSTMGSGRQPAAGLGCRRARRLAPAQLRPRRRRLAVSRPNSARSWLSRLCASTLAVASSTSRMRDFDRRLLQLGRRLGLGVAGLDLVAALR